MKKMTTTNCQPSQNERAKKKQDLWLFILYKNIINVNVFWFVQIEFKAWAYGIEKHKNIISAMEVTYLWAVLKCKKNEYQLNVCYKERDPKSFQWINSQNKQTSQTLKDIPVLMTNFMIIAYIWTAKVYICKILYFIHRPITSYVTNGNHFCCSVLFVFY